MSVDTNVYLGPYAEWLVPLTRRRTDGCRAPSRCPNPQSGYCPECGIPAGGRFRERDAPALEPTPEVDSLTGEALLAAGDVGCPWMDDGEGYAAFRCVPNVRRPGHSERDFFFREPGPLAEPLAGVAVEYELGWLARAFAPELEALARAFGEPPTLRWGLLRWRS